jgi:hypothetical protein
MLHAQNKLQAKAVYSRSGETILSSHKFSVVTAKILHDTASVISYYHIAICSYTVTGSHIAINIRAHSCHVVIVHVKICYSRTCIFSKNNATKDVSIICYARGDSSATSASELA